MNKHLTVAALLVAGTAFANAGNFYWVPQTTGSNEFGATVDSGENTLSNWRYVDESKNPNTNYYVTPKTYDSVESALAETDKNSGWKQANPYKSGEGIDYTIGGVNAGTVISVDKVYAVNGFTQAYYTSGNATLDFGSSGALFTYYTLKLNGVNIKVDFSFLIIYFAISKRLCTHSTCY